MMMRRLATRSLIVVTSLLIPAIVAYASAPWSLPRHWFQGANGIDIGHGRDVFLARCASCHALGSVGNSIGPRLDTIGQAAGTRQPGKSAPEYLLESILKPDAFRVQGTTAQMPVAIAHQLDDATIRDLVGFLASQGAEADFPEIARLRIERPKNNPISNSTVDRQAIEHGRDLFFGKGTCSTCHVLYDSIAEATRGPNLASASSKDEAYLRESILDPSRSIRPDYQQISVALADGTVLSGRLIARNDREIVMLPTSGTGDGRPVHVDLARVERDEKGIPVVQIQTTSSMPSFDAKVLSSQEVDALVAFLKEAGWRGSR